MLKKLILGAALASTCVLASAATPTQWQFSWRGLSDWYGTFYPNLEYKGTFSGIDLNHDNVISGSELTELTIKGVNFVNCPVSANVSYCGVVGFSYTQGGDLAFQAGISHYYDYSDGSWSEDTIRYNASESVEYEHRETQMLDSYGYQSTAQTVITVTPVMAAVPEPATYAMLGAGLFMLAAAARRKKQR